MFKALYPYLNKPEDPHLEEVIKSLSEQQKLFLPIQNLDVLRIMKNSKAIKLQTFSFPNKIKT